MVTRKALIALAAAGVVFGSTASAAAPAARSASPVSVSEELGGGSFAWIVGILIAAGVIAVIAADDDEEPASA